MGESGGLAVSMAALHLVGLSCDTSHLSKEHHTSDGRAVVVRSGYHPEHTLQTGIGWVTVKVPKIRAKRGKPATFGNPPEIFIKKAAHPTPDRILSL